MKKYVFETAKTQWEKPTEPKYIFCATAKTIVYAETEADAKKMAEEKLTKQYLGSGVRFLGEAKLLSVDELPADWSYGYGDERKTGLTGDIGDLVGSNVIR